MLFCLFVFFALRENIKAQNTNMSLQYIDHSTGIINNYNTSNINSDFGPRICSLCSKWHKGIDLNRDGSTDHGDRIITPVTGTIAQIYHYNTYIVLVINGPGNQDYGYGHIFENYSENALPIVLGDFVLTKMNAPHTSVLAIIDLSNNRAFSTTTNGTVDYGNYPTFTTTNTVQAGWPICPVGNSAASNGTHLHLYLLLDPSNNPQNTNNAKNPLQFIDHQNTNFDVNIIETNNLTEFGQTIFHSGDHRGSVGIEVKMNGAGNTSTYSNQIMDIEKVQLNVKKFGQTDNDYQLMIGNNYTGEILLGGRINNNRYPSSGYPTGNTSFDIATDYGSPTRTGIDPFAYRAIEANPRPWDIWYFSDIYTRIHKDDNFTGPLKLATSNSEARYTDGVYLLKPKAYKIDNSEADLLVDPKQILIDNFRPYISNVKIKEYGATEFKYNRGWQWVNNSLLFEPLPIPEQKFDNNKDIVIEVTTSEPMQWVNITVGNCSRVATCGSDLNKTQWEFTIPKSDLTTGRNQIIMDGRDLADNPIQSNPASIPIRQSNTSWTPTPNPGVDQYHSFIFGNTTVDFTATQLGFPANTIRFEDASECSSNCSYYWNFGDPANSWSINEDIDKTYSITGVYNVKHSVNNVEVSKYVSVNELSKPKSKFVYSPLYTGGNRFGPEISVDFFSTSEGIIGTYFWDFGNGITSDQKNVEGIVLELNREYLVSLTVTNETGSDTYTESIYIDPATYPFASVFDWEINYFLHDIEIATSNFNDDFPLKFDINFGDGTSQTVDNIYNNYYTFTHQYYNMGRFLIVATVTGLDNTGHSRTVTNAKEISVYPDDLIVDISYVSANNPPYSNEEVMLTAQIDPPGSFYGNWAVYKKGDPLFYFSQNFASTSPELTYNFPEAGTYRIIIDLSTSGGPSYGHAEMEIEVVNAPKFIDVELYGRNTICQHTSYTYTARLWPVGEPGVPENQWLPTNLRWTLFDPNGSQVVCNDCSKVLHDYQSQDLQYHEFHFTDPGIYRLRLEAWNDQHGYENYQLNPDYSNTLSFYDYEEMEITVSPGLPALSVITPNLPYVDNISSSGNNDVIVEFTNPGTSSITWEILSSNPDCVPAPQPNSGLNLHSGSIVNITLDVLPNLHPDSRSSVITINGKDLNGNHVQGSPAHILIYQNGSEGADRDYIFGQTPGHAFGYSVSIDGMTLAVGSPSTSSGGEVLIYEKDLYGDWVNRAILHSSDNNPDLGKSIELYGDYVFATGEGHNQAYVFRKPETGWNGSQTELKIINNNFSSNQGINLSLWDDYAAIGAPYHNDKGIVQIYYRNEGGTDNWGCIKSIIGVENDDQFGESVDIYNNILAVGAPQGGYRKGYINVYDRVVDPQDSWKFIQRIQPDDYPPSQNSKFGQRVSVFNDAVATSYFIDQDPFISQLYFPLYRRNTGVTFDFYDDDLMPLSWSQFCYNSVVSISLFINSEEYNPPEYDYKASYGSDYGGNYIGLAGLGYFFEHYAYGYQFRFGWGSPLEVYRPEDFYGKSVSRSYGYEFIGIPGYNLEGAFGAVSFQKLTDIKSNFEAGIDYNLCNFAKPSGNYSTVNAANISLGGESFSAIIESGANIQYEAGEILLKDGFIADRGSNFTALSLQQSDGPGMKPDTFEPEHVIEKPLLTQVNNAHILKAFQHKYPDFPWILYNPDSDISISLPDKGLLIEMNNQNNLANNQTNDTLPDQNPIQTFYIMHLPGHDNKLRLPVNSNNTY